MDDHRLHTRFEAQSYRGGRPSNESPGRRTCNSSGMIPRYDISTVMITENKLLELSQFDSMVEKLRSYLSPISFEDKKRKDLQVDVETFVRTHIFGALRKGLEGMSTTYNTSKNEYTVPQEYIYNPKKFQKEIKDRINEGLVKDRLIKVDLVSNKPIYPKF